MINIKNLSVSKNKRLLLKNINLEIKEGERWYIHGRTEGEILFSVLSGLSNRFTGTVSSIGHDPCQRETAYYRKCIFIPSFFPVIQLPCRAYIKHFKTMYPDCNVKEVTANAEEMGIDLKKSIHKLKFNERKLFLLLLHLFRNWKVLIVQDFFHGFPSRDKCCIHNLLKRLTGENRSVIFTGGRLYDHRDMISHIAVFSQGLLNAALSCKLLSKKLDVIYVKSRRYIQENFLYSDRATGGWKVLRKNTDALPSPPDFGLIESWLNSTNDFDVSILSENTISEEGAKEENLSIKEGDGAHE